MKRWSSSKALAWSRQIRWQVGCNYTPRYAGNQLEMWQKATFDLNTIRQELEWARSIGMNAVRIFLHDLLWQTDQKGLLNRLDRVLQLAAKLKIDVMVVLFDSVWHPFPVAGAQRGPEPHVHNSMWVQSPGIEILRDPKKFQALEPFVTGVVSHFADDKRVLIWDLWNEPDNTNGASYGPRDLGSSKSGIVCERLPLVFKWARKARPTQPLTSGIWLGNWESDETLAPHERIQLEESDVISFHCYGPPADLEQRIGQLKRYGRPLFCTEFMSRASGSTFEGTLPILKQHNVGAYCWGLVNGRTQTIYPWDSWQKQYTGEPDPWFHDVFRADGSPYRAEETKLITELAGDNIPNVPGSGVNKAKSSRKK